jgi:predicted chitinase
MANELSKYFGKDYLSNPQLVGLDTNQKSNFTIITNKAKEKGITSNYAIAGLLGIVSKESSFKATTEGSYRSTKAPRVRQVFGSKRTSKYNDKEIESFSKDDNKFFDFVYGYIAKENGFSTLGNDNPGDGFRYRGRGFNQLTFKNIYRDRGKGSSLDLVNNPELIEQPSNAAAVLIEYYLNSFKGLSSEVAKKAGITKSQNSLATINSITSVEIAVDMFYLATSGSMVMSNYNKILKYKSGSVKNTDGSFGFPNDNLGGYTKARNRAPYFYQILTGNKLPDTLPTSNPPSDTQNKEAPPVDEKPKDTIEQPSSGESNEQTESQDQKNQDFTPVQLTQIFEPTIKPSRISLDAQTTNKRQRKDFLTGLGTGPFVYYNGIHIEYKDMSYFELYHEGILPAIKITFSDRNGIFKDKGFPTDDTTISIFLYSRSKRLRSINMDFKISNFKDLGQNDFSIMGIANIPEIYLRKFKSYSKKTSFGALQDLAKECELGFCSNISDSNDKMTWINTGFPNYEFIENIVKNSYLNDSAFLRCYIDFYYNLCYVDVEKELTRNNESDKMITSNGKNEFTSNPEEDEDIASLILSTDNSTKNTNAFISDYVVTNKSTQISLNKAYLTKTKFYDSKSKELLIFDVDSITSQGDKTIIMKGKPGDENYFKNNVSNIWVGKLDKFNDDGNAHDNFNYSLIQNQINIDEISKISIEINLPSPNYNLYILEKIYLALLKQKPGVNQSSLRYKRLTGNWLSTGISFIFDGSKFFQKINLIKRELELDDYEKNATDGQSQNKNNTEDFQDNQNELSPNDTPPNNPGQVNNQSQNTTESKVGNPSSATSTDVPDNNLIPQPGVNTKLLYVTGSGIKFIIDSSQGLAGQRLKKIITDLSNYLKSNGYSDVYLISNGIMRDLAAASKGGGARAAGSLHGSGLALDIAYKGGPSKYDSKKGWVGPEMTLTGGKKSKWETIGDNKNLASDTQLVKTIWNWVKTQKDITWGAEWGNSNLEQGLVKGRGITEFHHFEIKKEYIKQYWLPWEGDLKSLGFSSNDLITTNELGKLYKKLA